MKTYEYELTGQSPLLLHADNIEWADQMDKLKSIRKTRKTTKGDVDEVEAVVSKPGDDRYPGFRWIGCLYHEGGKLVMPIENLRKCMSDAAFHAAGGRAKDSIGKAVVMTSIVFMDPPEILIDGRSIDYAPIGAMVSEQSYQAHEELARGLGFRLWAKRAKIGNGKSATKHVRVRPRFDRWTLRGLIEVGSTVSDEKLSPLFSTAGSRIGLGDWRPGGQTPGPFGRFTATLRQVEV